jgi:hypothetical protein
MSVHLAPGFYTNLFDISVPDNEIHVMRAERSKYPDLKELREEIEKGRKEAFVYCPERCDFVYGYGKNMDWLSAKGFALSTVKLHEEPKLAARMALEGLTERVKELGYATIPSKDKGRCRLFNWNEFKATSNSQIRVYTGYDIKIIFLRDPVENKLNFGLVIDVTYSIKDTADQPLDYNTISTRFGSSALREMRQIQKDLIPTGINKEVSKQRLTEDIIPFVERIGKIVMPCNIEAEVDTKPSQIILGEGYEAVR